MMTNQQTGLNKYDNILWAINQLEQYISMEHECGMYYQKEKTKSQPTRKQMIQQARLEYYALINEHPEERRDRREDA